MGGRRQKAAYQAPPLRGGFSGMLGKDFRRVLLRGSQQPALAETKGTLTRFRRRGRDYNTFRVLLSNSWGAKHVLSV